MNNKEIEDRVCRILTEDIGVSTDGGALDVEAALLEGLGMTSMQFMELLVELECQFEIAIPEEKILVENFGNIKRVAAFVRRELGDSPKESP